MLAERHYQKLVDHLSKVCSYADPSIRALVCYAVGLTDLRGQFTPSHLGKLVRPLMCLGVCECLGRIDDSVYTVATSLELVHAFSLVHDDIVDKDRVRRHRQSLWTAVGMPLALNAGDALLALAGLIATEHSAEVAKELMQATLDMSQGQHLDILAGSSGHEDIVSYMVTAQKKTGALMGASLAIGAKLAAAELAIVDRLREYGRLMGVGFQMRDDYLAFWGASKLIGKPVGLKRAFKDKSSIVHVLARINGVGVNEEPQALKAEVENLIRRVYENMQGYADGFDNACLRHLLIGLGKEMLYRES